MKTGLIGNHVDHIKMLHTVVIAKMIIIFDLFE